MTSQNELHPRPNYLSDQEKDPCKTVNGLLAIVQTLHHKSYEFHVERSRVERSNEEEANETNTLSDFKGRIRYPTHLNIILEKLRSDLELVKQRLINLHELREEVNKKLLKRYPPLELLRKQADSSRFSYCLTEGMRKDLDDVTSKISTLVGKLSVLPDKPTIQKTFHSHDSSADNNGRKCSHLPGLQEMEDLTKCEAFRQVKEEFMKLDYERRMCLLSFAVFPENREVHRTMLMYWWIGEGILSVDGVEQTASEVLKEFTDKNLVEPVEERRKVAPSSFKMTSFVHSSVIHLSKVIGLFDIYHKREKPSMNISKMGKVCLVEGSSSRKKIPPLDIKSVFNVSERNPEFTLKWFSEDIPNKKLIKISTTMFKSLHVFYLGRWERTQKRYIQVRNPELMKCLKRMKSLRILSFQGISTVRNLKSSVCKLHKLIVLDLRECYDLTKLPEKIDSLQSLVYLDMTGCHMLEWVPMRMALLHNLEVVKGFVVSDTIYEGVACTLILLKRLKKLRKLSIEIHRDDLSVNQLMEELVKLKALTSLKVTWRRDLNMVRAGKPDDSTKIKSLPDQLQKLDLQRFPHEQLPVWLQPHNLLHLKKLHIGGGKTLTGFGELKATKCAVEVLRLTSLPKLRVGWIELKKLYFPKLSFLENYECPRVSLTPCDGNGIWRSDQDD